jgi:Ran GTPase-activating protein (RanGAP) involved in mRNA processing and transport
MVCFRCGFRHIDISNNPLGDGGIRELSEALHKTYTVLTLKLRSCRMSDAGCAHLIKALQINASIRVLDIENNDISPASHYAALVSHL